MAIYPKLLRGAILKGKNVDSQHWQIIRVLLVRIGQFRQETPSLRQI